MENRTLGILIVALGAAAVLVGLRVLAGGLGWFGRLPGDARIESGNVRVFAPVTSMLRVPVGPTRVPWLVRRFT